MSPPLVLITRFAAAALGYQAKVLADGPVAYFQLEESSGLIAANQIAPSVSGTADGSGEFVIVGDNGFIYHTTDNGATWNQRTNPAGSVDMHSVAYIRVPLDGSPGSSYKWIAVGDSATIITSSDGITWTQQTAPVAVSTKALGWVDQSSLGGKNPNELLIGVRLASGNNDLLTSTDGINWSIVDITTFSGTSGSKWTLASNNKGRWVITAGDASTSYTHTDNLSTFTGHNHIFTLGRLFCVEHNKKHGGLSRWVMGGSDNSGNGCIQIANDNGDGTSFDGVNMTLALTSIGNGGIGSLCTDEQGNWVASRPSGGGGKKTWYSSDEAASWTEADIAGSPDIHVGTPTDIGTDNSTFMLVEADVAAGGFIQRSLDSGVTWTDITPTWPGSGNRPRSIAGARDIPLNLANYTNFPTGVDEGFQEPSITTEAGTFAIHLNSELDQYIDMDPIDFDPDETSWTWECWMRTTSETVRQQFRLMNSRGTGAIGSTPGIQLQSDGGWSATIIEDNAGNFVGNDGASGVWTLAGPATQADGDPHHIVLTWDTTTGTAELFIDGVSLGTDTNSAMIGGVGSPASGIGDMTQSFLTPIRVGAPANTTPPTIQQYDGDIDEIAFYQYVLTPTQILNHYAAGISGYSRPTSLPYQNEVLYDGPIIYFTLSETSGTTARSATGRPTSGTYNGGAVLNNPPIISTAGTLSPSPKTARSVFFDGVDDYMEDELDIYWNPVASSFTWECWMQTTTAPSGNTRLMDTRGTGPVGSTPGIQLSFNATDWGNVIVEDAAGNSAGFTAFSGVSYTQDDGSPHHIVLTWDTTTGTAELFIDGVSVASDTNAAMIGASLTTGSPAVPFRVATASNGVGTTHNYTGFISDVAIYQSVLSPTQVLKHYNKGIGSPEGLYQAKILADGPLAYYKLDETSGTTAFDSSTGSPITDGTYVGGPTLGSASIISESGTSSVSFDASETQYVSVDPAPPVFNFNGTSFSMECWMRTTAETGTPNFRLMDTRGTGPVGFTPGVQVSCAGGATWGNFVIEDQAGNITGSTTNAPWRNRTFVENDGYPHHIVATWDTTTGTARLYIDGKLIGTQVNAAMIGADLTSNTGRFTIGGPANFSGTQLFEGDIDEVAVYDYVLSDAQVLAHYNAG